MRKTILIILISIFSFQYASSQTNIDSINWQLRGLFGNLAKPNPPKLFNWDMAVHFVDSSLYVPINVDDTLNLDKWSRMYTEMRNSAYDTTAWLHFDDIFYPNLQYGGDTLNMFTMYFDYYRFKPGVLDTNIYFNFDTVNNILTDKYPRPGYPYNDYTVFASAPNKYRTRYQSVTYRIGTDNLLFDNFHPLIASNPKNYTMRANFHDGSGWHYVTFGVDNYFHVVYPTEGQYPIEIEIHEKRQGNSLIAKSVSSIKAPKYRIGPNDIANQTLNVHGMNINVYEPCNNQAPEHVKTLVYLEGLDVEDFFSRENDAQALYESAFIRSGLADLRNFGYRILVVDWQNSRINMHDNADNVVALLDDLKCGTFFGDLNIQEQVVLMGESMGGIIANLALLKMENGHQSPCFPEKEHNVHLLVTNDSPFEGAHIPMSIQKMARFLQNQATGRIAPLLPVLLKYYFKKNDILLDGDAAKQLLVDHVSNVSLLGIPTYDQHQMRYDFEQDVQALGNHPRHCKMVAMSDGNMLGLGQTRYWDGDDRTAGDALLHARTTLHGTILGRRFNLIQGNIQLNTDPNGNGDLGDLSAGTWWVKIRLKWFGIRFYVGMNSALLRDWDGSMRPISTAAGGLLDYNFVIQDELIDNFGLNYTANANGTWERLNNNRWGWDTRVRTDGFHWNFIPVSSAFNFGPNLVVPYDNLSIGSFMNHPLMPFDVIYGVPGNTQIGGPTTIQADFQNNVEIRNFDHTQLINDTLTDNAGGNPPDFHRLYTSFCPPGPTQILNRPTQMLNKEVGDNELYLNNRVLPCLASFSISDQIVVNQLNPYYNYPSGVSTVDAMPSVYSKEEPFIIDNNALAQLTTTTGNVTYDPPFTGPFTTPSYNFVPCCENYYKTTPEVKSIFRELQDGLTIFPNPTTNKFVMKFVPKETGLLHWKIVDLQGRVVQKGNQNVGVENTEYHLPITLQSNLVSGQYILLSQYNESYFTNKLIIQ